MCKRRMRSTQGPGLPSASLCRILTKNLITMFRSVIVDDEPKNVRILNSLLKQFCPDVAVLGTADNGKAGVELIRKEKPDLVFLDIEMRHGNAFDMLDELQPVN